MQPAAVLHSSVRLFWTRAELAVDAPEQSSAGVSVKGYESVHSDATGSYDLHTMKCCEAEALPWLAVDGAQDQQAAPCIVIEV